MPTPDTARFSSIQPQPGISKTEVGSSKVAFGRLRGSTNGQVITEERNPRPSVENLIFQDTRGKRSGEIAASIPISDQRLEANRRPPFGSLAQSRNRSSRVIWNHTLLKMYKWSGSVSGTGVRGAISFRRLFHKILILQTNRNR